MMTIQRETASGRAEGGSAVTLRAAGWLAFAASPTFVFMAWIAANDVPSSAFCSRGPSILPIGGMTAMYLLMTLFHLSPWLKLGFGRAWTNT